MCTVWEVKVEQLSGTQIVCTVRETKVEQLSGTYIVYTVWEVKVEQLSGTQIVCTVWDPIQCTLSMYLKAVLLWPDIAIYSRNMSP